MSSLEHSLTFNTLGPFGYSKEFFADGDTDLEEVRRFTEADPDSTVYWVCTYGQLDFYYGSRGQDPGAGLAYHKMDVDENGVATCFNRKKFANLFAEANISVPSVKSTISLFGANLDTHCHDFKAKTISERSTHKLFPLLTTVAGSRILTPKSIRGVSSEGDLIIAYDDPMFGGNMGWVRSKASGGRMLLDGRFVCYDTSNDEDRMNVMFPVAIKTHAIRFHHDGRNEIIPVTYITLMYNGSRYIRRNAPIFAENFSPTGRKLKKDLFDFYKPAPNWSSVIREEQKNIEEQEVISIANTLFAAVMTASEASFLKEKKVIERVEEKIQEISLKFSNSQNQRSLYERRIRRYSSTIEETERVVFDMQIRLDEYLAMGEDASNQAIDTMLENLNDYETNLAHYRKRLDQTEESLAASLESDEVGTKLKRKLDKLTVQKNLLVTRLARKNKEILSNADADIPWADNYRNSNFIVTRIEFMSIVTGSRTAATDENIVELLSDSNQKLHSLYLVNESPLEIKLDQREALKHGLEPDTRLAGPLKYELTWGSTGYPSLFISPASNECIIGHNGPERYGNANYINFLPHTGPINKDTDGLRYIKIGVCLGEAEGGLMSAWASNDIDLAIQFVMGWATNADTHDTWGQKAKEWFPAPSDLVIVPPEAYVEQRNATAAEYGLDNFQYIFKSKRNVIRYELTEKGWYMTKNNVTYTIPGRLSSTSEFVARHIHKLQASSVYREVAEM